MPINYNTKFVGFSYEPMKIRFCKNLYQLMKLNTFLMSMEEKTKIIKHVYNPQNILKKLGFQKQI